MLWGKIAMETSGEKIDWEAYLSENLDLPFDAVVSDCQDHGPVKEGDKISVKSISFEDDKYGILVETRLSRRKHYLPLVDLTVLDEKSHNYKLVDTYQDWWANTR
jgi:hypothetical protein